MFSADFRIAEQNLDKKMKGGDVMINDKGIKRQYNLSDDSSIFSGLGDLTDQTAVAKKGRGNQGFASMSKEKQREIASKGGKAAHRAGTAHEWDSQEAANAGRRGGQSRSSAQHLSN